MEKEKTIIFEFTKKEVGVLIEGLEERYQWDIIRKKMFKIPYDQNDEDVMRFIILAKKLKMKI
ncbi:MAG: hypothetical protein FWE22_05360 [Firmicutes bacterium]|nr:hypothetical protein [Bacillota bacterium]